MDLEIIGWIGSFCFAICAIPQAYMSYKDGHSRGISWGLLILWFIGEVCTLIYIAPKKHIPLIFNYLSNLLFILIILKYKVFERRVLKVE